MPSTFRLAELCDTEHLVVYSFQDPVVAARLAAGRTVRPDGRRCPVWLRDRYRHLRSRCHTLFGFPDRAHFWAHGAWDSVAAFWPWAKGSDDVFLVLRIPVFELVVLDRWVWDSALMCFPAGHRPGGCTPACEADEAWHCTVVSDYFARAEAAHQDDRWVPREDRNGVLQNRDDPFVQEAVDSWDQVFLPVAGRPTEVVTPHLRPEWVVSARPASDYGRRPTQPAPDVTDQPAFAHVQVAQEEAVLSANPYAIYGPSRPGGASVPAAA